jgi:hypothetical protein
VTTPETTDDLALEVEQPAGAAILEVALAEGLDAVARLHEAALDLIAHLAETWNSPDDEVRVLRLAERPAVSQRVEAAAA